jgi:hypothetical protein
MALRHFRRNLSWTVWTPLSKRGGNSFLWGPSKSVNPKVDNLGVYSHLSCPLTYGKSFPVVGNKSVIPLIVGLLEDSGPLAVIFAVWAVVVDAINGVIF